jgi:hypothetical protein
MSAKGYQYREFFIPDYMVEGLDLWIEHAILPGDFLTAVLCNDLMEACGRADETNIRNLPAYCAYLYNCAPPACFGSSAKVRAWIKTKRERLEMPESA